MAKYPQQKKMNITQVQNYESSDDDIEVDPELATTIKKKTRTSKVWLIDQTYSNAAEAKKYIKDQKEWSFHYKNSTAEGEKHYYRCNKAKLAGPQCAAGRYLHYLNDSHRVICFKTDAEHTHEDQNPNKITPEIREEIKKLYEMKLKPKAILREINRSNNVSIKMADNEPFVVNHKFIYNDDEYESESEDEDEAGEEVDTDTEYKFRYYMSTKRLLRLASNSKHICADGTYKLNWHGFPLIVLGTTDLDRHFHSFGIAVVTNETKNDYKFAFDSINIGLAKINEPLHKPTMLISDSANAIRNGYTLSFGNSNYIMCWAHARRKIVENILKSVDKDYQEEFELDIDQLQLSSTQEIFADAKEMFKKKWKTKKQITMLAYLEERYFTTHDTWYEGVQMYVPSQNNACEGTNRTIEDEHTIRERLTMALFKLSMVNMLRIWSESYDFEKKFFEIATIVLDTWTKAYNWNKSSKQLKSVEKDDSVRYYTPTGDKLTITDSEISTVELKRWNTFEQFKKRAFSVWIVDLPKNGEKWLEGTCTCPVFMKEYICKHVVGIALRLKYTRAPPQAKNVPLGQKRKLGRPAKAKKALLVQ